MTTGAEAPAYLGVSRSLSGRIWRARPAEEDTVRRLQMSQGLSEPLARAIAARGIGAEAGDAYLNPTLKALFPDPSSFMDMDQAASILIDALVKDRPITVFADYDVDGASSAAQLVRWFRLMKPLLPNMVRLADIDEESDRAVILANYKKPFQRARFGRVMGEVRRRLLTE